MTKTPVFAYSVNKEKALVVVGAFAGHCEI